MVNETKMFSKSRREYLYRLLVLADQSDKLTGLYEKIADLAVG